jgi:hypothetical protein
MAILCAGATAAVLIGLLRAYGPTFATLVGAVCFAAFMASLSTLLWFEERRRAG